MYKFCPLYSLEKYSFVVIVTKNENGEYLLSRKANGNTWEFQGGHIEEQETPFEAANRELKEEAGIYDAMITPLVDYQTDEKDTHGIIKGEVRYGMIFVAKILKSDIRKELVNEMEEVRFFDILPCNMTYLQMAKSIEELIKNGVSS